VTPLHEMPEFLAGYVRGYTHGVEHRLNPPTKRDIELADEPLSFTAWEKVRGKSTPPGGTAAETPPAPELAAEHASRAALADARSVPPPQVRPPGGAPSATRQAAEWSETDAAVESVLLQVEQILRENHLSVAASLVQRARLRLRFGEDA